MLSRLTYRFVGIFIIICVFLMVIHQYRKPSYIRLGILFAKKSADYALLSDKHEQQAGNFPETIIGETVILRKFSHDDFDAYQQQLANKTVYDMFFLGAQGQEPNLNVPFYLYSQLMGQYFGERIIYTVIDKDKGHIGGMIELISNKESTRGHISGWTNPQHWGTGQSQETLDLATQAFFDYTPNKEINVYTTAKNQRCVNFLTKYGFTFKGVSDDSRSFGDLMFYLKRDAKMAKNA